MALTVVIRHQTMYVNLLAVTEGLDGCIEEITLTTYQKLSIQSYTYSGRNNGRLRYGRQDRMGKCMLW